MNSYTDTFFSVIQKMPIDWEPMLKGENLKTCVILNGTEYKHVTHMFEKTLNLPIRKVSIALQV